MGAAFMVKYRRFSAIHLASHMRIVWCPACHCGVVPSAAAAAATRRPSVVAAPEVQLPGQGSSSFLWGLWGGGGARAAEAEQGEVPPRRRPSLCIGCPGCQQSLCMSCRALHAPGVDCTAAAVAAEVANTADANDGGWGVAEQDGGDEAGGGGGGAGDGSGATRRALEGSQEARFEEEPPTTSTKRCPKCHVPIFKDGRCTRRRCVIKMASCNQILRSISISTMLRARSSSKRFSTDEKTRRPRESNRPDRISTFGRGFLRFVFAMVVILEYKVLSS